MIDSDSDDLTGEIGLYIQFKDQPVCKKAFTEESFRQFCRKWYYFFIVFEDASELVDNIIYGEKVNL